MYPFSDCTKDNPDIHTVLEHGYGRQELATAVAAEGLRPTLPKAGPAGLTHLLQSAWSLDPAVRPTAQQLRESLAALLHQALQQQQQEQHYEAAGSMQQQSIFQQQHQHDGLRAGVDSCCGGAAEDVASHMELNELSSVATGAAGAAAAPGQQCESDSMPGSSAASDVFVKEPQALASPAVSFYTSSGLNLQLMGRPAQRRMPRSSSASTLSTAGGATGFSAGGNSSTGLNITANPPITEVANAAAAAAAAAAVPAAASLQGVLSLTAAAGVTGAAAAAVEAGAFGALGPRESMEDRHVVVQGLGGDPRVILAAVFDGHRGFEAAAYAAGQLPRNLLLASVRASSCQSAGQQQQLQDGSNSSSRDPAAVHGAGSEQPCEDNSSDTAVALKQAFLATDAAFWQEWQAELHGRSSAAQQHTERYPGCTALAAVVAGRQLFVANAGDGRAVLSRGGAAVPLSRQHTADLADERARVLAAGGTVSYRGGSWRVGPAALQVTRALGDFDLKVPGQQQHQQQRYSPYHNIPLNSSSSSSDNCNDSSSGPAAASMPVTAEPEVVSLQLTASDQFLIIGTDGLWDVVSDQEAVGLVHDTVKDPYLCAKRLVMEALSRGSTDNVSAVVLFLQPKDTLERVWKRGEGLAVPAVTPTFYGSRRATTPQLAEQAGVAPAAAPAGVADELRDTY